MKNKILKVGIVGSGGMAEVHILALRKIKGFLPVAIFSHHTERLKYISERYNLKIIEGYNLLIQECDVVDIVTRNITHIDYAQPALDAGRHLIIEKPIDVDVAKAEAFLRKASNKSVKVTVISQNRYNDNIKKFIRDRDNNRLGNIFYLHANLMWRRDEDYYKANLGWRGRIKDSGGGAVIHQGIHLLDLLLWLFGDVKVIHSLNKTLRPCVEVEDLSAACLEFSNSILATLGFSTQACNNHPFKIDIYGTGGTALIIGTDGYKFIDSTGCAKRGIVNKILRRAGLSYVAPFSRKLKEGTIQKQLELFYQDIVNNTMETSNLEGSIKTLKLAYKILHNI